MCWISREGERDRETCIVVISNNLMNVISWKERVCYFKKLNNIITQSLGVWTTADSIETLIWSGQPDSTYHNFSICMFCIICAFKTWFHRKSVLSKPLKKRYIIACASKHILRSMDVSVNKTRNQKLTEMKRKFRLNIALAFYDSLTLITLVLSAWCRLIQN